MICPACNGLGRLVIQGCDFLCEPCKGVPASTAQIQEWARAETAQLFADLGAYFSNNELRCRMRERISDTLGVVRLLNRGSVSGYRRQAERHTKGDLQMAKLFAAYAGVEAAVQEFDEKIRNQRF